jgi:outer membrane lipoprotein carrier protein
VADGQTISLYDPDLRQVTIRSWSNDPALNPAVLLAGDVAVSNYFEVVMGSATGGREYELETEDSTVQHSTDSFRFRLFPLDEGGVIEQIELIFTDSSPSELSITDTLGQTTRILLTNVELNVAVEEELFRLQVPEGVDVFYAD